MKTKFGELTTGDVVLYKIDDYNKFICIVRSKENGILILEYGASKKEIKKVIYPYVYNDHGEAVGFDEVTEFNKRRKGYYRLNFSFSFVDNELLSGACLKHINL